METQERIDSLKRLDARIKARIVERVTAELEPVDMRARYVDMLDELYTFEPMGSPFKYMSPARVLEEMDSIAFRCGLSEFIDQEEGETVTGEIGADFAHYDLDEYRRIAEEVEDEVEGEEVASA